MYLFKNEKVLHASGHKFGNVRKIIDILCCEWRLLHKQSSRHHHRSYEVMESTTKRCVKSTSSGYNCALDIKASAVAIPPRSRERAPRVLHFFSKTPAWARGIEASVSAIPPGIATLLLHMADGELPGPTQLGRVFLLRRQMSYLHATDAEFRKCQNRSSKV